jgi:ATP-binding protein involved in chromosome partitioning
MERDENACEECSSSSCSARERRGGESDREFQERRQLARRMCGIGHKILILSGKGGVGKSSIAASLAIELARLGRRVGILDIDLHGPSIPRLLGILDGRVTGSGDSITPVRTRDGLLVMSMGLLLQNRDDALIWRGPLKYSMIKQFLRDVEWGELDYLVVDSPPGTGDEPLSIAQLIEDADGAVVVTTPQGLSVSDVRKSVNFARQLNLPVLGVIENMSGYVCPGCGARTDVFGAGGGEEMARDMGVPFLGAVPMDARLVPASDVGLLAEYLLSDAPGAQAISSIVEGLVDLVEVGGSKRKSTDNG